MNISKTHRIPPMTYLHQYDLGPTMSPAEIEQHLRNARGSQALSAVLQHLRNKAAEMDAASRQPPPHLPTPGDYRAYHDGAASALEEVFRGLHQLAESAIPDDEQGEEDVDHDA